MLKLMNKVFFIAVLAMFAFNAQSQSGEAKETPEQVAQINYLKGAMQKEIWSVILTDTFELQLQELKDGIIFKEEGKKSVLKYQWLMTEICVEEKVSSCPEAFFTRKKNIPVASMYPNGKKYAKI